MTHELQAHITATFAETACELSLTDLESQRWSKILAFPLMVDGEAIKCSIMFLSAGLRHDALRISVNGWCTSATIHAAMASSCTFCGLPAADSIRHAITDGVRGILYGGRRGLSDGDRPDVLLDEMRHLTS